MKFWLLVVLCVTYCSSGNVLSAALNDGDSVAQSSLQFTWDAYQALDIPSGQNVFFSPYSIMNAMGMLVLGSSGETETQLKNALRVPTSLSGSDMHADLREENSKLQSETEATIGVANRFFVDEGSVANVSPDYRDKLKQLYNSTLQSTPFAEDPTKARTMVNDFVSEHTRGQIPNMITGNLNPSTKLMLINAIYFKGDWTTRFNKDLTQSLPFHAKSGDVTAQFMRMKTDLRYAECPDKNCQVVALPYTENEKYAMYLIVPKEGLDLETLESGMDSESLRSLMDSIRSRTVEIHMPRFTMKNQLRLRSMFAKLGATDIPGPQGGNNSKIFTTSGPDSSFVDDVIHEAKVEVNENGTIAAAATASVALSIDLSQKNVVLDRPFLFFIVDTSNDFVLFWGRLENPSSE